MGEDCWRLEGRYAKVGAGVDGVVGATLSAPEGREESIEEVGQSGVLSVSSMAAVVASCLEGYEG